MAEQDERIKGFSGAKSKDFSKSWKSFDPFILSGHSASFPLTRLAKKMLLPGSLTLFNTIALTIAPHYVPALLTPDYRLLLRPIFALLVTFSQ